MSTAKPQYPGDGTGRLSRRFSDSLIEDLKRIYLALKPDSNEGTDSGFRFTVDDFVDEVVGEARWVIDELDQPEPTKQTLRAVREDLLTTLGELEAKFRKLPVAFENMLPDVLPSGVADQLKTLMEAVDRTGALIERRPTLPRAVQGTRPLMEELAVRVLRVLRDYEVPVTTPPAADFEKDSPALLVLQKIALDLQVDLKASTWRDIIMKARRSAGDLNTPGARKNGRLD